MTASDQRQPEALLDAYLDGLLGDDQREAFEDQLERQPDLRAALEQQRAIDAALNRRFQPPKSDEMPVTLDTASVTGRAPAAPRWGRGVRRLAVAAALAGGVFGAWMIWDVLGPKPDGYVPGPWRSLEVVYRDEVEAGFEPGWVCESDAEFADTFWNQYRQRLLLAAVPDGTTALGLSYCNSISRNTTYLLAEVDGHPVIVFVDRASRDTGQELGPGSDLNIFSRRVGALVLYEISPLGRPRLLDVFYDPDADKTRSKS